MSRTNVDNFESERFVKKLAILRTIRSDLETLSRPHLASLRQTLFPCWCGWLFNSKAQELFDEWSICRYDIGVSFIYKMCSQLPHLNGVNKVCNCADPGFPKRDCVVRSTLHTDVPLGNCQALHIFYLQQPYQPYLFGTCT